MWVNIFDKISILNSKLGLSLTDIWIYVYSSDGREIDAILGFMVDIYEITFPEKQQRFDIRNLCWHKKRPAKIPEVNISVLRMPNSVWVIVLMNLVAKWQAGEPKYIDHYRNNEAKQKIMKSLSIYMSSGSSKPPEIRACDLNVCPCRVIGIKGVISGF